MEAFLVCLESRRGTFDATIVCMAFLCDVLLKNSVAPNPIPNWLSLSLMWRRLTGDTYMRIHLGWDQAGLYTSEMVITRKYRPHSCLVNLLRFISG